MMPHRCSAYEQQLCDNIGNRHGFSRSCILDVTLGLLSPVRTETFHHHKPFDCVDSRGRREALLQNMGLTE